MTSRFLAFTFLAFAASQAIANAPTSTAVPQHMITVRVAPTGEAALLTEQNAWQVIDPVSQRAGDVQFLEKPEVTSQAVVDDLAYRGGGGRGGGGWRGGPGIGRGGPIGGGWRGGPGIVRGPGWRGPGWGWGGYAPYYPNIGYGYPCGYYYVGPYIYSNYCWY